MEDAKTPEQVINALAADWRENGLRYQDITKITGYKYQTIANFISGKKTYFTVDQARRLEPMGYRMEFLMFGTGCLRKEDDIEDALKGGKNSLTDQKKLGILMSCFKSIGDIYDDPMMQVIYKKFYRAITTDKEAEVAECIMDIRQMISLSAMMHHCTYDENGTLVRAEPSEWPEATGSLSMEDLVREAEGEDDK